MSVAGDLMAGPRQLADRPPQFGRTGRYRSPSRRRPAHCQLHRQIAAAVGGGNAFQAHRDITRPVTAHVLLVSKWIDAWEQRTYLDDRSSHGARFDFAQRLEILPC
jgi:hypothetical protein